MRRMWPARLSTIALAKMCVNSVMHEGERVANACAGPIQPLVGAAHSQRRTEAL
jgi:hypothetical protein